MKGAQQGARQGGRIVTFYSYKGGVGRSMALANIATLLARDHGLRVIVVDWDLEAPGLHRFFRIPNEKVHRGVIDFFTSYKAKLLDEGRDLSLKDVDLRPWLMRIREYPSGGQLRILPAGGLARHFAYARAVNEFDWDEFYQAWNGAQVVEYLRSQLKELGDMVLIDSRTGITDVGGICTLQLPDAVVLVFTFNEQNLAGTESIARDISKENPFLDKLDRRPQLFLLPTRKELGELTLLRQWERKVADRLTPYISLRHGRSSFEDTLSFIREASIPYIPYFAYGEELAVESEKGFELASAYQPTLRSLLGEARTPPRPAPGSIDWAISRLEVWLGARRNFALAHSGALVALTGGTLSVATELGIETFLGGVCFGAAGAFMNSALRAIVPTAVRGRLMARLLNRVSADIAIATISGGLVMLLPIRGVLEVIIAGFASATLLGLVGRLSLLVGGHITAKRRLLE